MGSARRARILLRACMGHVLSNASVQTQGEAWLAMAKCDIAEYSLAAAAAAAVGGGVDDGGAVGVVVDGGCDAGAGDLDPG